jgi:hypothetical protein
MVIVSEDDMSPLLLTSHSSLCFRLAFTLLTVQWAALVDYKQTGYMHACIYAFSFFTFISHY